MEQQTLHENVGESAQQVEDEERTRLQKVKDKFLPGVKIGLVISLIFYIAMFGIGIWGTHKCPINDNIPFFLIVTGAIGLFSKTMTIVREKVFTHYEKVHFIESSLYTAETVFFLLGSYWVFREYKPSFHPSAGEQYCNKTVYMFAFVYLTFIYALFIVILLGFFCFLGCIFFVKQTETPEEDPEAQTRIRQSQEAPPQN